MGMADIQAPPQNLTKGIIFILGTTFFISTQDIIFKLYSTDIPLGQLFAFRSILALPLFFALAWMQGLRFSILRDALRGWSLIRGALITVMLLLFYAAVPFVNLSVLGAATYTAPIFVTLLSAYFFGETVGKRGWTAVLTGFIGVLVLLQPGTDDFSPLAALPLLGAIFYATAHILTRNKCQNIPAPALALALTFTMMVAGFLIGLVASIFTPSAEIAAKFPNLFGDWITLDQNGWLLMALLALLALVVSIGLAMSYKVAPSSKIATFEYSYLLFALAWDVLFFNSSVTPFALTGMGLIFFAGLLLMKK